MKKILSALLIILCARIVDARPLTRTIVVFPFENRSSSSNVGWISEAFAQVFSERMAGPGRYVLSRIELNDAYHLEGIPPYTTLTLASEYKVAETLGVDWAVVGNFKVTGDKIEANAQILDLPQLRLFATVTGGGPLPQLIAIQTRMVWDLLKGSDRGLQVDEADFARRFTEPPIDAFEMYIRGLVAQDGPTKIRFLEAAARLDSTDHRADFALGRFYFRQKAYALSVLWLDKLDAHDPGYPTSLFLRGLDDLFLKRNQGAEAAFEALSHRMPLSEVWSNLGVAQLRLQHLPDALSSFTRAYQSDPTNATYSYNLGLCYCALKQYPKAVPYLKKACAESTKDPSARLLLAFAREKGSDPGESTGQLEDGATSDGQTVGDLSAGALPQPLIRLTYNGEAFRLLSVAVHNSLKSDLSKMPAEDQGRFHLIQGEKLIRNDMYPQAVGELKEACSLLPRSSAAHLLLGEAYELNGQHELAVGQFHAALDLFDNAVGHLWLAHAYFSLRELEEAQVEAQEALSLDPQSADAKRLLRAIQEQMKNTEKEP